MKIERLKLANVRAFEAVEFEFADGVNLLVGINGVGKSTVLDALRVLLSHSLKAVFADKNKTLDFETDDINLGQDFLTAELFGSIEGNDFSFLIHRQRDEFVTNPEAAGQVRHQTTETPSRYELTESKVDPKAIKNKPIAVFFSPHRSIVATRKAAGKVAFSAADSLDERELQIQEFAGWLLTREALAKESEIAGAQIGALNQAVDTFLENFQNLKAVREPKPTLTIEKKGLIEAEIPGKLRETQTILTVSKPDTNLDVRQLSDGERGVLALVLDLTFRLAAANPKLENPARDGKAVVLIDELDLHLHPKWQREIVDRLETTFPNCQFIVTTHSPQIVGEVAPEKIWILSREEIFKPEQSRGMDTNWILKYLMETPERDEETQKELDEIAELIEQENYEEAQQKLDDLRNDLQGGDEDLVRLQTRIDRFTILNEE